MARPAEDSSPLSVALDASLWDEPTTGISLYGKKLATALEGAGLRVRRIGARRAGENPRGECSSTVYFLAKLAPILSNLDEPLFHAVCNFNLPPARVSGKRFVLTVHDLIPELVPQSVSLAFRLQFRLWLSRSVRVADKIICVSRRTRDDLAARFDVAEEKLAVVYHGADHVDAVPAPDATGVAFVQSLALPEQLVLYAGALDARKNVEVLISAASRLRTSGQPITLVLAGQNWYGSDEIAARLARARRDGADIRSLGYQDDSVFYALMRRATVFAFPSRYEGFGLPPLEAMRLGVPTVVSTAGALPEICADGARQVAPDDVEAWASTLAHLMASPQERQALASLGRKRAAQFSWNETARRTIDVYRSALEELQ